MSFILMLILFILGYMCIALEHPLKVNKSATALILSALIWAVYALGGDSIYAVTHFGENYQNYLAAHPESNFMGFLTHGELIGALGETAEILFFLLGAMTIVEMIDRHQGFQLITSKIKTTNACKLMWILSFLTFFMSAVLDNLTTSIVMVALLRKLIGDKKDRWFFAGIIILAANAGGAWSPIGDVTTIMLWIGGQITAMNVILKVFVPSLVAMVVPLIFISVRMRKKTIAPQITAPDEEKGFEVPDWQKRLLLFLGIGALLFVPVFKMVTHLPPYLGILLGLGVLWLTTEILHRNHKQAHQELNAVSLLKHVDVSSVLFFLGILMAVAALQSSGHLSLLSQTLDTYVGRGNYEFIAMIIGVLSSIVDNVPLVAGTMGMYSLVDFVVDHPFWEMLAYCAGTGGSILIIGSAAGVAVMGMEKIDFVWYLKKISIWAVLGYFSGAAMFLLMGRFFW